MVDGWARSLAQGECRCGQSAVKGKRTAMAPSSVPLARTLVIGGFSDGASVVPVAESANEALLGSQGVSEVSC